MDEFIQSIKQRFSMENIIETIKDELEDPKKVKAEEIKKVETDKINKEQIEIVNEMQTKSSAEPMLEDLKKADAGQKKQPSVNTAMNVLQKPNQPEEVDDPFGENENLFSFCD